MREQSEGESPKTVGAPIILGSDPFGPPGKTVKIPVRVVNGTVEMLYGGPFPSIIKDDCVAELTLPADFVTDDFLLTWIQKEHKVELLPEGAYVFLALNVDHVPKELRPNTLTLKQLDSGICCWAGGFTPALVQVVLLEPLILWMRGSKKSSLDACRCVVPALFGESGPAVASSLNHAYHLVSQKFEPNRRSHTANVFLRAVCQANNGWFSLDELRSSYEARLEKCLIFACRWNAAQVAARQASRPRVRTAAQLTFWQENSKSGQESRCTEEELWRYIEHRLSQVAPGLSDYLHSEYNRALSVLRDFVTGPASSEYPGFRYSVGSRLKETATSIASSCQKPDPELLKSLPTLTCDLIFRTRDYLNDGFDLDKEADVKFLNVVNEILSLVLQESEPGGS